ncbi:hypothetical protein NQ317_012608 [Molorchus minor]|uniref:Uncharacterized protein n=1 Tax=Molorchus minor TaxID=1323400 RepID=A0ABQ9JK46_9CUCU|nr:hypothetical protein NQ317_012608 [Molorchus minor]
MIQDKKVTFRTFISIYVAVVVKKSASKTVKSAFTHIALTVSVHKCHHFVPLGVVPEEQKGMKFAFLRSLKH